MALTTVPSASGVDGVKLQLPLPSAVTCPIGNGDSAGSILTGGLNRDAGENVGVYGINQGATPCWRSRSSCSPARS